MKAIKTGVCLAALAATGGCASFAGFAPGARGPTFYAHDITAPPAGQDDRRAIRRERDRREAGIMTVDVTGYLTGAVRVGAAVAQTRNDAKAGEAGVAAPASAELSARSAAIMAISSVSAGNGVDPMTDALGRFEAFGSLEPAVAQAQRDALVGMLVLASDRNCSLYLDNLRKTQATYQSTFTMTSMVLSSAAGFTPTDIRTARVLSGLSSLTSGAADTLDRSVFAEQNTSVIIGAIENSRAAQRQELFAKMAQPYATWRMSNALADAFDYHGQCSVSAGLSYLAFATGVNSDLQRRVQSGSAQNSAAVQQAVNTVRTQSDKTADRLTTTQTPPAGGTTP